MKIQCHHLALLALASLPVVHAFSPAASNSSNGPRRCSTKLFNANQEKLLREQVAKRLAQVDAEGKYAIPDGQDFEKMDTPRSPPPPTEEVMNVSADMVDTASTLETAADDIAPVDTGKKSLASIMERITKPRAFPLFLAEKAAELIEESLYGIVKTFRPPAEKTNGSSVKEKVVILGSGWGAVSFLKEIDPELYDVTVISPRNHFTFTPMLVRFSQRLSLPRRRLFRSHHCCLLFGAGWSKCWHRGVSIHYAANPRSKPQGTVLGGFCQGD